jgi:hypothetical protein
MQLYTASDLHPSATQRESGRAAREGQKALLRRGIQLKEVERSAKRFRQLLLGDSAIAVDVANLHRYCAVHVHYQRHPLPATALPSSTNAIALRHFLLLAMSRCSCSGDSQFRRSVVENDKERCQRGRINAADVASSTTWVRRKVGLISCRSLLKRDGADPAESRRQVGTDRYV